MKNIDLSTIVSLSKRRGFVYPGSDIYGGLANTYDYGPYGVELKNNVKKLWWNKFVKSREDMYGIDSSIFLKPDVWKASGHTESFVERVVEDKVTHKRYRADHLIENHYAKKDKEMTADGLPLEKMEEIIDKEGIKSPDGNELTEPKLFKALFETKIGIVEDEASTAYLRGEIAQGLFLNFKNIRDTFHPKLPFGIAQAGKAFRNEISQGQFTFRTLEFDLMEFEYFFDKDEQKWEKLFEEWQTEIKDFALLIGVNPKKMRWRKHEEYELSHYSKRTEDLEYKFPWGFKEMFACAYRTDFDLKNHMKHTGVNLAYIKQDGTKIMPHVIEPTFGLSRAVSILLFDSYREDEVNGKKRVYMKFEPKVAPVKVAVFPLQKDSKLQSIARDIFDSLKTKYSCEYDESGSIGKRYRRQDEIGTPFCITVDFDSIDDNKVTIRDRDTLKQVRIEIDRVEKWLEKKLT